MTQISSEELDSIEAEFGDDADFEEAAETLKDCEFDIQAAIAEIADRAGADVQATLKYVDRQCQRVLCDSDVSERLPELAGAVTAAISGGLANSLKFAPLENYAPVLGCLAAIGVQKGLQAYCERPELEYELE